MFLFKVTATTEIYTYCHTLSLPDALPTSARARRRIVAAESARDHADEAAVHRAAHDVRQDRTRRADERAGDDHRGVAEREAHRRRGPARIAAEHRHDARHVGAANRDDQQETAQEAEARDRPDAPWAQTGNAEGREREFTDV